jgi:hypothetical protein
MESTWTAMAAIKRETFGVSGEMIRLKARTKLFT